MTTKTIPLFLAIGAVLITGGCTAGGELDGELILPDPALLQPAGITLGGRLANGERDGLARPGTEIFGDSAKGTSSDSIALNGLRLRGSALVSTELLSGQVLGGSELTGATFRTATASMDPVEIRIDAVDVDPTTVDQTDLPWGYDSTVSRYTIAFRLGDEHEWTFACGIGENGSPTRAIALEHRWDYRQAKLGGGSKIDAPGWITFACEGFALARCVDLGYQPWNKLGDESLAGHHQACTRMIRADYCGDGRSFSSNAPMVDVFDAMGIQAATPSFSPPEAEWTEAGARCVHTSRNPLIPMDGCRFEIKKEACGTPPHWDKTLLVSQAP